LEVAFLSKEYMFYLLNKLHIKRTYYVNEDVDAKFLEKEGAI